MRILRIIENRLRSLFSLARLENDLALEIDIHMDQLVRELTAGGMSPAEARREARRQFGSVVLTKERCRDMRRVSFLEDLIQDLRYTIRSLIRSPGYAAVVIATLAGGIGANIAIFTIVQGVLLRPLEYPNPEQLMYLTAESPVARDDRGALSVPEYIELRQMSRSFAAIGAYSTSGAAYSTSEVNLTAGDRPLRVRSIAVDAHLLEAIGIRPEHGRLFRDEETSRWTGTLPPPIAILSHELWKTAFEGRSLVGQKVQIEGRAHEVVGIMPPGADLMDNQTQVWLPLWLHPSTAQQRGFHVLHVIARRKSGVSAEAAQTELRTFLENWGDRVGAQDHVPTNHPRRAADHTLQLRALHDVIVGSAGRTIWILQAAVGFVLLIVCANLTNLLMARAGTRRRELVLRAALGANRGRLLRQSITEGALLAGAGGILGLGLAGAGLRALFRAFPASIPRTSELTMDLPILFVAFGLTTAVALLFGFVLLGHQGSDGDMGTVLKEGAKGAAGARRGYTRHALVIAQVALAVILVIGAGLLIQTVFNLTRIDAGFDRSRLATFSITLPMANSDPDTRAQAYQRLLGKLRSIPGVLETAAMSGLPPNRNPDSIATPIENYTNEDGKQHEIVDYFQFVAGDYFRTMGIPIIAGRGFEPADNASQGKLAIVNESLARKLWHGRNPIGQRLRPPGGLFGASEDAWHTVIGVARDVRQHGVEVPAGTEVYVSLDQHGVSPPSMNIVMRTTLPSVALAAVIERTVREVDATVPVVRLRDMDSVFAESIRRPTLLAQLLGGFAGLALLLAALGTYGVLSYVVTERRREIAIRMAIGAVHSQVLAQIMKQGLHVTAIGILIGLGGALVANRMIVSLLYGVQPADFPTIASVVATVTAVALIASWIPARRACRVDPNLVLRED